ncbi:uncharacterized protein TM35_000201950 [Trypanosoma theileri]|uniref:Uncharacterized protein n=1 Tax=Trypanosoma theileri TaxID=67003 RepID=A0A1X0NSV0_9TRYP|nr:uncharacterized protein TM35_000201950 [Trypanosoma theileri]ORC87786.1 hypothetical protein TM35_000201950 [Trypanosoma theileri]
MAGEGSESSKVLKEGDPTAQHTFSVDAAPFEPNVSAPLFMPEKWQYSSSTVQEQSAPPGINQSWTYSPQYYDMMMRMNLPAMVHANALLSSGLRRYSGTPIVRASSPVKKNNNSSEAMKRMEKGSLSVYAKPWSPTPEGGLTQGENDAYCHLKKEWVKVSYRGEMVVAPLAFMETNNIFVHSFTLRPLEKPGVQFQIFNYLCGRCTTRSFFGRLSCRNADVTLKGIAGDIPPLRIAHLIEQVTGVVVSALFTEGDYTEYELWLEKPEKATHVVNTVSGALWSCPMFHGYAVHAKTDEDKKFLNEYITSIKNIFPEPSPYPMCCVEAFGSSCETVKA